MQAIYCLLSIMFLPFAVIFNTEFDTPVATVGQRFITRGDVLIVVQRTNNELLRNMDIMWLLYFINVFMPG